MLLIKNIVITEQNPTAIQQTETNSINSYIEFCDSMVFGIDPRSRLKGESTLSVMRLVLVASRSALIVLADEAIGEYCIALLSYFVCNSANIISAEK